MTWQTSTDVALQCTFSADVDEKALPGWEQTFARSVERGTPWLIGPHQQPQNFRRLLPRTFTDLPPCTLFELAWNPPYLHLQRPAQGIRLLVDGMPLPPPEDGSQWPPPLELTDGVEVCLLGASSGGDARVLLKFRVMAVNLSEARAQLEAALAESRRLVARLQQELQEEQAKHRQRLGGRSEHCPLSYECGCGISCAGTGPQTLGSIPLPQEMPLKAAEPAGGIDIVVECVHSCSVEVAALPRWQRCLQRRLPAVAPWPVGPEQQPEAFRRLLRGPLELKGTGCLFELYWEPPCLYLRRPASDPALLVDGEPAKPAHALLGDVEVRLCSGKDLATQLAFRVRRDVAMEQAAIDAWLFEGPLPSRSETSEADGAEDCYHL